MEIKKYNQMVKHITSNNNTPAENRIADLKQNLPNQKRMLKKRNDLGINTTALKESVIKAEQEIEDFKAPIKQDDPMTTWVKNNNANNKNPGTFKRLVKQDEKEYKQKLAKKSALDKVGENLIDALVVYEDLDPKEQIVTYDSATQLFSNKKKDIAFKDAATARKHNQAYEKYIPEIQKLKKAVEPSSFIKHRQKVGDVIRNQKDKKVVLLNKVKPVQLKFNYSPMLDVNLGNTQFKADPQLDALGEKVFREAKESQEEKERIQKSGLGSLLNLKNGKY
jgi:hypothetical protein